MGGSNQKIMGGGTKRRRAGLMGGGSSQSRMTERSRNRRVTGHLVEIYCIPGFIVSSTFIFVIQCE